MIDSRRIAAGLFRSRSGLCQRYATERAMPGKVDLFIRFGFNTVRGMAHDHITLPVSSHEASQTMKERPTEDPLHQMHDSFG